MGSTAGVQYIAKFPAGVTTFTGSSGITYAPNAYQQVVINSTDLQAFVNAGFTITTSKIIAGLDWFIDPVTGSDTLNDGSSWNKPYATVSKALTQIVNYDRIWVKGAGTGHDGIHEELTTPSGIHYCSIIGAGPTPRSNTWKAASTPAAPLLTIQGFGWKFINWKFEASSLYSAMQLLRTASVDGSDAEFWGCEFHGGLYGIESKGGCGNWLVQNCRFHDLTGGAIFSTSQSQSTPLRPRIFDSEFVNNDVHVKCPMNDALIARCVFQGQGNSMTATTLLDISGGTTGRNVVSQNNFGGTYSIAGGYKAGTNDTWDDNNISSGKTSALPA